MTQTLDARYNANCLRAVRFKPSGDPIPRPSGAGRRVFRRKVLRRLLQLKLEGLKLYRPLPHLVAFHTCTARWRIVGGSNRSSKTLSCAAEFARAVTGSDPFDKFPGANGNALVVCLDLDQVATIWRKLAQPGAFKIVPDERTKLYRSVRPDPHNPLQLDPYDEAYREKWRDAPPLIPTRLIRKVAWEDCRREVPRLVEMGQGWRALFRSGDGRPPQGDHYNLGWIDEQIGNESFIVEMIRGLTALDEPPNWLPKAFWSATAQVAHPTLTDMRRLAEDGSPNHAFFNALIEQNPYVSAEEKRVLYDSLPEDERGARYHGVPAIVGRYCYPTFDAQGVHGYEPIPIPADWCVYIWLDPGTRHCATLFLAVDPQERHVWVYDGFDARVEDAADWGRRVADRLGGRVLPAAGIDQVAGRQNAFSAGMTVAERYWRALLDAGVTPREVGPMGGFLPGSNDTEAREEALRSWLAVRSGGPFAGLPTLKLARGALPKLESQIRRACVDVNRRSGKESRQKAAAKDFLDCLEYAAHYGAHYHEPSYEKPEVDTVVWDNFRAQRRRRHARTAYKVQFG